MSLYVSIIGIDGSGKSTVTPALASLVAAELNVPTAAVGDGLWCQTPEEDLFAPGFAPDGDMLPARLARFFRRAAKAATSYRRLYPPLKLAHLAMQEWAARQITRHYRPDVIFCEGNLLLSAAARAINYMDPQAAVSAGTPNALPHVEALVDYVMEGKPLSPSMIRAIPGLKWMRPLRRLDAWLRLGMMRLPDALVFLDITPETALARLMASGQRLDRHENVHDLTQARAMYHGAVAFFCNRRGDRRAATIDVTRLSIGQTLCRILDFVRTLPIHPRDLSENERGRLGMASVELSRASTMVKKVLTYQYLIRYALPNLGKGSAHELTFPLSRLGRLFLKEGYSAETMKVIYLRNNRRHGLLDRAFLEYPLHQAIYHRLQILNRLIESELRQRLERLPNGETIKVLTAPSGYAFDLLQPLERFAGSHPERIRPVHILASDLDPAGRIERELIQATQRVGIKLAFVRGDLTSALMREQFKSLGPYDVVIFVGFSCWISKPHLVSHLKLIRQHLLAAGGGLIADCFTPRAFALSGQYLGYKANYYSPREFTSILTYCGFDSTNVTWESGPEVISHVCVARAHTPAI